jgi:hypothetical protein
MTVNSSIKLAYHIPTEKIIHIDNADNGKDCKCECLECKGELIAVQGDERDYHFRHDPNNNCNGFQETALHQLGKQIIIENNQITIPKIGQINYSNTFSEKEFDRIRPDVIAIYNQKHIFFEIAVKHFIEKDKQDFYTNGQYKCIEIDLSEADLNSYEKIKSLILNETYNKKLFGWKEIENSERKAINWFSSLIDDIIVGALVFVILGFFYRFFSKNKSRHKRYRYRHRGSLNQASLQRSDFYS